jgi:hypothetical protein
MNAGRLFRKARVRRGGARGSALIEASIALPLLVILLLGVVDFGFYIYDWITVVNAARAAAEYQVLGRLAPGGPSSPLYPQVLANFNNDVSSLPNYATNASLEICSFSSSGNSCQSSGPAPSISPYLDPYGFTVWAAAAQYSFTPIIPVPFLQPQTITQIVYMRSLQ